MVTADPKEARDAVERGERVVLIVAGEDTTTPARPGRMAVMVGDAGDPAVRTAASEMDAELYGR